MTDINTVKEFAEALKATSSKPKPYDTTAEVIRVEDNTAWVHIPGGIDETPVQLSIDAKAGDSVNVRVSGGRAWITGNSSRPPTDDAVANKANTTATEAQAVAEEAQETAEEASQIAQATKNYFWHDAEGAHVSTVEGDATTGPNVLIDVNGMKIRMGADTLAEFLANLITLGGTSATISLCDSVDIHTEIDVSGDTHSYLTAKGNGTAGNVDLNINAAIPEDVSGQAANISLYSSYNAGGFILSRIDATASKSVNIGVPDGAMVSCHDDSMALDGGNNPVRVIDASVFTVNGYELMPIRGAISNLNNATEYGIYTYENTASNKPNTAGGSLVVYKSSSTYWVQLAYPNNNNGSFTQYGRMHYSSGYGSWT